MKIFQLGPVPEFSASDPDTIVIGGGAFGAAFAARLGMDGKKVVIIERDMNTPESFRGELILPGTIRALDRLGMKGL